MHHSFKHYELFELEDKTPEQLEKLALVDQILSLPNFDDYEPAELERMSADALRSMLASVKPAAPAKQSKPSPVANLRPDLPQWALEAAAKTARARNTTPRYPAKVWDSSLGRAVHLGVFDTLEARDTAVSAAKFRRSMGLSVK